MPMVELSTPLLKQAASLSSFGVGCPGTWWSPSPGVLKKCVDVALRDVVTGHGGDGLALG